MYDSDEIVKWKKVVGISCGKNRMMMMKSSVCRDFLQFDEEKERSSTSKQKEQTKINACSLNSFF